MTQRQTEKELAHAVMLLAHNAQTNISKVVVVVLSSSLGLVIQTPCQCLIKLKHTHTYTYTCLVHSLDIDGNNNEMYICYIANVMHIRDVHGMEKGESICRFFFLVKDSLSIFFKTKIQSNGLVKSQTII